MEIPIHSHLDSHTVIATNFCTWHDSCASSSLQVILLYLITTRPHSIPCPIVTIFVYSTSVVKFLIVQTSSLEIPPMFDSHWHNMWHYLDVIMRAMASQITGILCICSTLDSGTDQRKHQSTTSLAFARGIHRWPVDSPHKGSVTQKTFPSDDVIMSISEEMG